MTLRVTAIRVANVSNSGRITQPVAVPSAEAIDEMAESFGSTGQLQPIWVDTDLRLIFGAVRLAAAQELGWECIDAVVYDGPMSDADRALLRWNENRSKSARTLQEQADLVQLLEPTFARREQLHRSMNGGTRTAGDTTPPAVRELAETDFPAGDTVPPAVKRIMNEPGKRRDVIAKLGPYDARTVDKFNELRAIASAEAVTPAIRPVVDDIVHQAGLTARPTPALKRVRELMSSDANGVEDDVPTAPLLWDVVSRVTLLKEHLDRVGVDALAAEAGATETWLEDYEGAFLAAESIVTFFTNVDARRKLAS